MGSSLHTRQSERSSYGVGGTSVLPLGEGGSGEECRHPLPPRMPKLPLTQRCPGAGLSGEEEQEVSWVPGRLTDGHPGAPPVLT